MSQHERALKQSIDLFLTEQRRLHAEVMAASVDTKIAAAQASSAADRIEKSSAELSKWTLAIQKRVEKLEIRQAFIAGGAMVAGAALWEKAKKALGLV